MQPPAYVPSTDLSQDELSNVGGRSTVRTAAVDAEFSAIEASIAAIRTNLALNQRDDGEIRDQRVKLFTLAQDVLALIAAYQATPRGNWLTSTAYAVKDLVSVSGITYMSVTAHTSGVFATDLAAGKWILFALNAQSVIDSFTQNFVYGQAIIDEFTGNGVQVDFSLTANPGAQTNFDIWISGVHQKNGDDFTWSSLAPLVLHFTAAPPNLTEIEVKYLSTLPVGTTEAGATAYNPATAYTDGSVGKQLQTIAAQLAALLAADTAISAAVDAEAAARAAAIAPISAQLANLPLSPIPVRALGIPVFGSSVMDAFGDSYTAGVGAAGPSTCYAALIGARFNSTFNNRGVGGTGVTKTLTQAWAYLPKWHMRGRLITWMAGFNDLHYGGGAVKTLQKIREGARAFMANAFLSKAWAANDTTTVTQTGTWTASTPNVWGEKAASLSGRALFSAVAGDKLSFTFNGESCVVGTWSNKNSTYTLAPVDVYIDSVFYETYQPNNSTDGNVSLPDTFEGLTHTARVYTGLGSGAHTLEVRNAGASGQYVMVDYFGTLAPPSECPSLLMAGVCYVDATGYATIGLELGRSQTIDDAASAVIRAEVDVFVSLGFPVAFIPPNDYYTASSQISVDHDHPGPAGHASIARAFISRAFVAANTSPPSCSFTKSATQSMVTATATAVTWSAAVDDYQGFRVSAATSRVYAPSNGTMRLSGAVVWATNSTGIRVLDVRKNGGGILRNLDARAGFATNDCAQSFSADIPVVAGDYLEVFGTQNSGGGLNVQVDSQLDVTMVR